MAIKKVGLYTCLFVFLITLSLALDAICRELDIPFFINILVNSLVGCLIGTVYSTVTRKK